MSDKFTNIKVTPLPEKSEVEITGDITVEAVTGFRNKALKSISEHAEMPGFRKGHVPEKMLIEKVGELYILEEAAELAMQEVAPVVIEKNAPEYIGRPAIAITKLAPGNPISFKITVAIMPEVTLPDYKKIAHAEMSKKAEAHTVEDKEVDAVIEEIRKQRAHHAFHAANKDHAGHDHAEEELAKHMPEFNDEFVKSLGAFESVADFREKAKTNILKEKEHKDIEKCRGAIYEKLVSDTKVNLPEALVENEIERMFSQFESDIMGIGLKVDDYLKHIKKTREDLRKDWRPDAVKRATLNLVLGEIAKKEKLVPEDELIAGEVKHLKEQHPEADSVRITAYVTHMLTLEKAIKFLEEQK